MLASFSSNWLLIFLLFSVAQSPVARTSSVHFQTGDSKFSRKYFDNFTMSFVNNSLNLDMIIRKPLTRGFKSHVDFAVSLGKPRQYQSVFGRVVDVCRMVSGLQNNIFKGWFQSMLDHGNFMVNCPVSVGPYFLRNWTLDPQLVPQFLYGGEYRVSSYTFFGKYKSKTEDFVLEMKLFAMLKTD